MKKNAKVVFKGIIFDTYHYPQRMYDGSIQTFEFIKRPDTVCVIAVKEGKIIVERQSQPDRKGWYYSLVAGRAEKDEKPLDAAKRELLEETGHKSSRWKLIRTYHPFSKIDWNLYIFIAAGCVEVSAPNLDAGEKIKLLYYTPEEFIKLCRDRNFMEMELSLDVLRMIKSELAAFKKLIIK